MTIIAQKPAFFSSSRTWVGSTARGLALAGVSGLALMAPLSGALAQGASDSNYGIEEIVVTSRKRGAEILQDIPASITALSESMLADMGVTDFSDFAFQVPGLTFSDGGPGEKRYIIRGIQSAGQQQVAVYYDEVPLPGVQSSTSDSGSQTTDLKIYDIQRVEILRGPQGTAFGANSQMGTVRFITNKPNLSILESSFKGTLSQTRKGDENWDAFAMVNIPLAQDRLAMRIVAYSGNDSGYVDNVRLINKDINWVETTGIRAMLRYAISENATLDFMVWHQKRDNGGDFSFMPFDSFALDGKDFRFTVDEDGNPTASRAAFLTEAFFQTGELRNGDFTFTGKPDNQDIWSATLNWDIGNFAHMTASASLYDREFDFKFDSTWIIFTFGIGDTPPLIRPDLNPAMTNQGQSIEQQAFEIRFNSTHGGPLQWMIGGFFRDRESKFKSFVPIVNEEGRLFDPGVPFFDPPAVGAGIDGCQPCVFARIANKDIEEKAIFGELSWNVTENIELMGGLRWFEVEQSDFGKTVFPFALFPPSEDLPDTIAVEEDKLIKKVQLSFHVSEDVVVFGLASQGFRLGGTNNQGILAVPALFESDKLWNFEAGIKASMLDNRLIINSSAFHIKWDNLQVAGQDDTGAFGFITNAGEAEVTGLEVEIFARPTPAWDIVLGGSWLPQRELVEDQRAEVALGDGEIITIEAPGRKGNTLPRIPEVTFNFSAQYNFGIPGYSDWNGRARFEYSFKGKSRTELVKDSALDRRQDSFNLVNFRFGLDSESLDGGLTFFVENVFDARPDLFITAAGDQPTRKITTRPRTIGFELTKRF